ncbi:MAG: GNAT family N-acetyltransferase [Bdellovibrio sp.]|nr:GNAT family N-acetyltransferase [Bdellovibrio sp.]
MDLESFLVVKTPSNPCYFWGNFLIFAHPPQLGDLAKWRLIFQDHFKDPRTYHVTFAWDSPEGTTGDISEFLADGFRFEKGVVLTTQNVRVPPKFHASLAVRPIEGDTEWEESIQIQLSCANATLSKLQWENFYRSQMERYKKMTKAGLGTWFGGFLGSKMVAGLGIFKDADIGRYQVVSTHADYQRQGVCGALVYKTAQYAFDQMGIKTLVMVADEEYHAAKIYESVGFTPTEKMLGVCWWDKTHE